MPHPNYDRWFRDVIAFYRTLEFFTHAPFADLAESECQRLIESRYPPDRDGHSWFATRFAEIVVTPKPDLFQLEQFILAEDKHRLWLADAESVYGGAKFYQGALEHLAAIARYTVRITDATEHWLDIPDSTDAVIHVAFRLDDLAHEFWIDRRGDWANSNFLTAVNARLPHTGQQFICYGDGGDWYVVLQTPAESASMRTRGWQLPDPTPVSGILCDPDVPSPHPPMRRDAWLYYHRGLARFARGDPAAAWTDWYTADQLGVPNVWPSVATLTKR